MFASCKMRSPFDRGPASLSNLLDELQTQRERQQKEKFIHNLTRKGSYLAIPLLLIWLLFLRGGSSGNSRLSSSSGMEMTNSTKMTCVVCLCANGGFSHWSLLHDLPRSASRSLTTCKNAATVGLTSMGSTAQTTAAATNTAATIDCSGKAKP